MNKNTDPASALQRSSSTDSVVSQVSALSPDNSLSVSLDSSSPNTYTQKLSMFPPPISSFQKKAAEVKRLHDLLENMPAPRLSRTDLGW
jgi:hypothetical protein